MHMPMCFWNLKFPTNPHPEHKSTNVILEIKIRPIYYRTVPIAYLRIVVVEYMTSTLKVPQSTSISTYTSTTSCSYS